MSLFSQQSIINNLHLFFGTIDKQDIVKTPLNGNFAIAY
jgi:hypothetical protein